MTQVAYLVWLKTWYGRVEKQVWWFNPAKMLKKHQDVIKTKEIPVEVADKLSLKELEAVYGSEPAN